MDDCECFFMTENNYGRSIRKVYSEWLFICLTYWWSMYAFLESTNWTCSLSMLVKHNVINMWMFEMVHNSPFFPHRWSNKHVSNVYIQTDQFILVDMLTYVTVYLLPVYHYYRILFIRSIVLDKTVAIFNVVWWIKHIMYDKFKSSQLFVSLGVLKVQNMSIGRLTRD